MAKYEIEWRRIWDFLECVEAESEDDARMIIHDERATKGSTVEIGNVTLYISEKKREEAEEVKAKDRVLIGDPIKETDKINRKLNATKTGGGKKGKK